MVVHQLPRISINIHSKWNAFAKSILFYPIVFAIGALALFLITSVADNSFPTGYSLNIEYFNPLIFTGSPGAARSILAAIATAWATILGVAFSVTLITLQLSVSRYISHLVNRFEGDKINQLSLGWFIFTVTYSLLVLKTVRTGESSINLATMMNMSSLSVSGNQQLDLSIFTPIIGVNVAIIISIIGLFMLILYLHNISSYLKPNILISKLIDQILDAFKPYEKRSPNQSSNDKRPSNSKIFEINSTRKGILSYIDWNKVSETLTELASQRQKNLWMDWSKSIGDWIEKQDNIAIVYGYDEFDGNQKIEKSKSSIKNENYDNHGKKNQSNQDGISKFEQKLLQSMEISGDRDLTRDPLFGIEVLRSVAVKSTDLGDTDVVKSCITGLFRILHYSLMHKEIIGIPFTIATEEPKRKVEKLPIQVEQGNNTHEANNKDNIHKSKRPLQSSNIEAIIKPKEVLLDNIVLAELSIVTDKILTTRNVPLIDHLVREYIAQCKNLIREAKYEEFRMLTDWCSGQVTLALESFPLYLSTSFIEQLLNFKKDLENSHPHFDKLYHIYMENILSRS
ncbi:hypothetical protein BH23THE1_BH23THE1_26820 [soil metagenome]